MTAMVKGPKVKVRAEEPELPGACAGATSLDPETVVGVAAAALGDNAATGASAITKNTKKKKKGKYSSQLQKFRNLLK